ncbi:unnamed protein product [Prorocentrum cordatum]|uniref:Uncharacterized protein n=1 Tax=Prorocentrum cordatum TaxID=2364126 RepID=A0ABN9Y436_9DINO|nr:unnamed protein product [Polarella glacialis]
MLEAIDERPVQLRQRDMQANQSEGKAWACAAANEKASSAAFGFIRSGNQVQPSVFEVLGEEQAGLGWDKMHPRQLRWLPMRYQSRFLNALHAWERGPIDSSLFPIPISLLPKCLGKTCDRAGHVHNLLAPHCVQVEGVASGTAAPDLSRCNDHVSHGILRREAKATKFPLALLRALCCAYRLGRRAQHLVALSVVVHSHGAIAAGCSCALGLAKLMVHTLLMEKVRRYHLVRAQSLVDDQLLQAFGTARLVPAALRFLADGFTERKLQVNWDKTGWLTGDAELAGILAKSWDGELSVPGASAAWVAMARQGCCAALWGKISVFRKLRSRLSACMP